MARAVVFDFGSFAIDRQVKNDDPLDLLKS